MGNELVSCSPMRLKGALLGSGSKNVFASVVAAVTAGAFSIPSAAGGIELGEGLSVTGFVDQSYFYSDADGVPASKSFGIDQVETDFVYTASNGISAQVDIEYGENASDIIPGDDTFVEQAFITKSFSDQFSVKLGRFLSYSGWETEEPTGLFQYSGTGYAPSFYGYYQQGVSASYNGGKFAVMGSLVNDVFGYAGGPIERDTDSLGFELGAALMLEGFTAKLFYMSDDKTDREVINFWASYSMNGFTFAGEYNDADYGVNGEGDGYLLMANYAKGNAGITVRYHDFSDDFRGMDRSAITISPSYKVGDKLLLVGEYRMDDLEGGIDGNSIALEALFMF